VPARGEALTGATKKIAARHDHGALFLEGRLVIDLGEGAGR
jgi:hypothetical protein